MKAKNKFQQQVVEASKSLPALTPTQIQWGYDKVVEHIGRRSDKGVITCTKCGHSWPGVGHLVDTLTDCKCPHCNVKLQVQTTKKRTFKSRYYMTVITAHKGYQVLRSVFITFSARVGEPATYDHLEVMQRWIAPSGKYCTFARLRQCMGTMYCDAWILNSDLELRQENGVYRILLDGKIYPRQSLIPELKRTGYKRNLYGQRPADLFYILLTDSRAETLLKTGNTKLLKHLMNGGWRDIERYWQSIRICIRNGYAIDDASLWCDYIDFLRYFEKDLHNAKYVCPADLKAEHDRYTAKKAKEDAQAELAEQLEKEAEFCAMKAKFFGLVFSDGQITVRVLESVKEIIEEGKAMHHCVGTYALKENSLILSATIKGKRVETIEVSLSELRVVQARGVCNENTKYHSKIVELVERNTPLIEQRAVAA